MNKKLASLLLKFSLIIGAYFIVVQFVDERLILYVTIGLSVVFIVFHFFKKRDPLDELNRFSNAENFLLKTKRSFAKNSTKKLVYMSYGRLYDGNIEESKKLLQGINIHDLKEDEETYHLYLQTILRHEYEQENVDEIEEIYKIVLNEETIHPNVRKIAKVMILMIEKKYQDVVDVLFEIIPKEDRRHVVMELEIILVEAYLVLGRKEDAKAVLEFVASKKYNIVHVEKAKSMLVGLS